MPKIINDFYHADNDSFYVHGMESEEQMAASVVHRPEGSMNWLFIYFYDCVEVQNDKRERQKNDGAALYIWPPGSPHHLGNTQKRWKHSWLHISGSIIDTWMNELNIPVFQYIDTMGSAEHEYFFHNMMRELGEYNEPDMHIVENIFENWLRRLKRSLTIEKTLDTRLLHVKRFIGSRFKEELSLQNLADEASMSVSHFSSSFKKQYHTTPMDFVINRRLEEASYLLGDHMLRIKEIAQRVGYEDEFHFSRLFKKKYGLSPKFYRQK